MTDIKIMTDLLVVFTISIKIVFMFHKFHLPPIAGFWLPGCLSSPTDSIPFPGDGQSTVTGGEHG
ncbi:MAG TPA: hypothetical protein VES96_00345 [Nitrospiraceae bacterium]|nr:hypothetical protein [Nitrospiraceae bacterium]